MGACLWGRTSAAGMLSRAGRGEPAPCHLRVGPAESIPASPPGVQTPEEGTLEYRNSILRETSLSVSRTSLCSWGEGAFRKVLSAVVTSGRLKGEGGVQFLAGGSHPTRGHRAAASQVPPGQRRHREKLPHKKSKMYSIWSHSHVFLNPRSWRPVDGMYFIQIFRLEQLNRSESHVTEPETAKRESTVSPSV